MKKIAVIAVNFNSGKRIVGLLNDLVKAGRQLASKFRLKVVLIDNASSDRSVEMFRDSESSLACRQAGIKNIKLTLMQNKQNVGFAKAANLGIKECLENGKFDDILLLNPDISLSPGALLSLLKTNADIAGPVIKFRRDNRWIYDFGGMVNSRMGNTWHRESESLADGRRALASPPDYLSGCVLLIKKEVFDKIGYFDERYFLYFEDVDFCLRAKAAGFSIGVEEESVVQHDLIVGRKKPFRQQFQHLKSNYIFVINNVPWQNKIWAFGYLQFLILKILFNAVIR